MANQIEPDDCNSPDWSANQVAARGIARAKCKTCTERNASTLCSCKNLARSRSKNTPYRKLMGLIPSQIDTSGLRTSAHVHIKKPRHSI